MRLPPILLFALCACGGASRTFVEPPTKVDVEVAPAVATITWEMGLNGQSVLIARTRGDVDATPPDGGGVGDALGEGLIRYVGEGTRFIDSSLPEGCGPFSWHLWGQAADGTWSKTAATVRSLRGAHTLPPTAQVSNLLTTFEGSELKVQWEPPEASTGFASVIVVRNFGSAPTSLDNGMRVYAGSASSFTEPAQNLSPSQDTYYAVFNCNSCGRCASNPPSIAVAAQGDGGVNLGITGLTATRSSDGQTVALAWASTAPRVKVLRTLNGPARGPTDTSAAVVFDGEGSSASEKTELLLPSVPLEARQYTYTAWACVGATCSAAPATTTFSLTLKQALQGGGYTLFFRHAPAGTCSDRTMLGTASTTTTPDWWKSCESACGTATAEQLTPTAADPELALVRGFFEASGVPVSRVLSSEFCRAVRTAEGFQLGPQVVEQVPQLTYFVYDEANRCRDTQSLLNGKPAAGTNVVHVGHAEYPAACPVLDTLNPTEALVYKPQLGAPARLVMRIAAGQWASLP
jgi:hypothetical protein